MAGLLVQQVDGRIPGRLAFEGVEVLPRGGVELHELRVYDPEGHLVLHVARARFFADLTRLAAGEVGMVVELDDPSVLLETAADGSVSLLRAFTPPSPAPAGTASSWTLRLSRLTVRGGEVWWRRADRTTAVEATGLDLDAEGAYGPAEGSLALRLRADVAEPVAESLSLEGALRLRGDRLEVPALQASLGPSALEGLAEVDLASGAFRAAVTRLGVGAAEARRLAPRVALRGGLAGAGYAESRGGLVTAAFDVRPEGGSSSGGTAFAAVAVRLPPAAARPPPAAVALGFDVTLTDLDPSRLLAQAPPGRLTLTARGAAEGRELADGRAWLALEVAPSWLRRGELGPVTLAARADHGLVEVVRLVARLPGLALAGQGRWRDGGELGGELTVDATDLALAGSNLAELAGEPLLPLGGRLHARATLAGTAAAPAGTLALDAPLLRAGAVRAEALVLNAAASGPWATANGRLVAAASRASAGGVEARRLDLAAGLAGDEVTLSFTALLPDLGNDPAALRGAARLSKDRKSAEVHALSLAWPGVRYALLRPATVALAGPSLVDRLQLGDGPRRLAVWGGLGPGRALDAGLEVVRLDLARLPRGILPPEAGARGELSLEAHASGTVDRIAATAHLAVAGGEARGLTGLEFLGDLGWNGASGRLTGSLALERSAGGSLHLSLDLPLPLARAGPGEPLGFTLEASGWPAQVVARAVERPEPVTGTMGAHLAVSGTVAAPQWKASLRLDDAVLRDLGPLAVAAMVEEAKGAARLTAAVRLAGGPLLDLELHFPLDLAALLQRPETTARGLLRVPLDGTLGVPGLDLTALSGKLGLPQGLAGTLTGRVVVSGTLAAPRGTGNLAVAGGAVAGYRDVTARLEAAAEAARTTLTLRASLGDAEALRLDAALGAPLERLQEPASLRAAPLLLELAVPGLPMAPAAGQALPMAGTLTAHLSVKGTLVRPEGRLDLAGQGLAVEGRPLGDLTAVVRYQEPTGTAELSLRPAAGGVLWAGATLEAALGLDTSLEALGRAPATLHVTADKLDLGFLPAVARGTVRAAAGQLTADFTAAGPLAGLRPLGSLKLEQGRLAISEYGEWSELELQAELTGQALEVAHFGARRGKGRLSGRLSARDLGAPAARLEGKLAFEQLTVARAGIEQATLDFPIEFAGTWTGNLLDLDATTPGGTIVLPKESPRELQSLEVRSDIAVGPPRAKETRPLWLGLQGLAGTSSRPFELRVRLRVPGKLWVKGDDPKVNVELKGDSTWHLAGGQLLADGSVEAVRGLVEPISGRVFRLERGRVDFTGGAWKDGQLDLLARYTNPAAVVTVAIGGTVRVPTIQLSSVPVMDDAAIAMLIATGRTEASANASGVGTLTSREVGMAAAGAAVSLAFQRMVAKKLPVDQITLDASTLRAGKYLTDRLFVGYTNRFDARPEKHENTNEATAQYRLSRRWSFELTYGDAQTGDASLIWSKDY